MVLLVVNDDGDGRIERKRALIEGVYVLNGNKEHAEKALERREDTRLWKGPGWKENAVLSRFFVPASRFMRTLCLPKEAKVAFCEVRASFHVKLQY